MQIFDSYIEAGQSMSKKDREQYYTALIEYLAYGVEPKVSGTADAVLTAIRPSLDESRMRSENGRRGGRPKSKTAKTGKAKPAFSEKPNAVFQESQTSENGKAEPKKTEKANGENAESQTPEIEKTKGKGNSKEIPIGISNPLNPPCGFEKADAAFGADALSEFNRITGQSVQSLSPSTWASLARIRQSGRTLADVTAVIQSKLEEWGGDRKMCSYIRPSTLFGQKFEEYLGAAKAGERRANRFAEYD